MCRTDGTHPALHGSMPGSMARCRRHMESASMPDDRLDGKTSMAPSMAPRWRLDGSMPGLSGRPLCGKFSRGSRVLARVPMAAAVRVLGRSCCSYRGRILTKKITIENDDEYLYTNMPQSCPPKTALTALWSSPVGDDEYQLVGGSNPARAVFAGYTAVQTHATCF